MSFSDWFRRALLSIRHEAVEKQTRDAGLAGVIIAASDDVCALPHLALAPGQVLVARDAHADVRVGVFRSHDVLADVVKVDVSATLEWCGTLVEFDMYWTVDE